MIWSGSASSGTASDRDCGLRGSVLAACRSTTPRNKTCGGEQDSGGRSVRERQSGFVSKQFEAKGTRGITAAPVWWIGVPQASYVLSFIAGVVIPPRP